VPSGPGGKNGLLAESLGRYFVIVPPQGSTPGAVYAYSTNPKSRYGTTVLSVSLAMK
jgi:hypothetical protein